jgi:hypothetical protein
MSHGQGSFGLQMQCPSLIERCMIRLLFSLSTMINLSFLENCNKGTQDNLVFLFLDGTEIQEHGIILHSWKNSGLMMAQRSGQTFD